MNQLSIKLENKLFKKTRNKLFIKIVAAVLTLALFLSI
jgi:hypothetical protein